MARRQRRRTNGGGGQSLMYRGPIRLPTGDGLDQRVVKQNLSLTQTFTSSAGGTLAGFISGADVSACPDYITLQTIYQEFRILGIEMKWIPYFDGSWNSTVTPSAGAAAVAHVPLSASPVTVSGVTEYPTWRSFSSSKTMTINWKMRGVEESPFIDTSAPSGANHGGLIWYIDNLSATKVYGRVVYTFLVEYRGRK